MKQESCKPDLLAGALRGLMIASMFAVLTACGGGGGGGTEAAPPPVTEAPVNPPANGQVVGPVITQQPADTAVEAGTTATFAVAIKDAAGASFQWLRNGAALSGATQSNLTVPGPAVADSGSRWSARVTNAGGVVFSNEAMLTVVPKAVPTPVGISMVARDVGVVADLATDAQGNTIAVLFAGTTVARKLSPAGLPVAYGPDGQGLVLPGQAPTTNFSPGTFFTGAAFAASGEVYVSNITTKSAGINAIAATGGTIYSVSSSGQATVLVSWAADSVGAVAPASVTLGPDGALYFVDYLSGHLMKWTAKTGASSVGDVQAIPGNGLVYDPRAFWIAVESPSRIYVLGRSALDSGKSLLRRVDGSAVSVIAGNADGGPNVDGTGKAAAFSWSASVPFSPTGLSLGAGGNLYVADGLIVRKVSPDGVVTTVAGQRQVNALIPGPLPGSLGTLGAMTIGADGVIHVMSDAGGLSSLQPARSGVQSLAKIRLQ